MKRSTKLIVAFLVVVAALAVTYRLMHRVPSADLEANVQMQQIITDAGCLRCHTSTPELPFYANMPVAGKIVMEDVSKAYRAFDMTQMEKDMKEGRPLNPVDLAKVEKVILDGKMPQAKYYLVHWGASFNDAKKGINKMDKEGADPDRVKQQLTEQSLVVEEWGGDVIAVPVSAKTGMGTFR